MHGARKIGFRVSVRWKSNDGGGMFSTGWKTVFKVVEGGTHLLLMFEEDPEY